MDAINYDNMFEVLLETVPEVRPIVVEHAEFNDGILQHVLMGELRVYTLEAFAKGEVPVVERMLKFLGAALMSGDELVENVVALSFVEHMGYYASDVNGTVSRRQFRAFLKMWPENLRAELTRQENWRPPQ